MSDEKKLTLADPCPKSPNGKHRDDCGMFYFQCKYCGLADEEDLEGCGTSGADNYPRLGR